MAKSSLTIPGVRVPFPSELLVIKDHEQRRLAIVAAVLQGLQTLVAAEVVAQEKTCKICGHPFYRRADADFCSNACKLKDFRRRHPGVSKS